MSESVYGTLRGAWNVEQAVLSTYQSWLPEYLAEVERQNRLQPKELPRPQTFEASDDFEGWDSADMPAVIVVVTPLKPVEESARDYQQDFEIQVGCIAEGQSEAEARKVAGLYGVAAMLLAQPGPGSLGGLVEEMQMVGAPKLEFVEADQRRLARSVTTFSCSLVLIQKLGPSGGTPQESNGFTTIEAPLTELPLVTSETLTIKGEPV